VKCVVSIIELRLAAKAVLLLAAGIVLAQCSSTTTSLDSSSSLRGAPVSALSELDGREGAAELHVQAPERWILPNGLTVFFAKDDELPVVSGALFTRGGALLEPLEEFGTVAAMADQMRQGGAGELSPEALDERLERLSAGINSGVGQEFGRFQFSSLDRDFEEVFNLFGDVVLRPRFEPARIELWKGQARASIKRRVDDPNTVASLSVNQLLFGGTPYGAVLTTSDLERFDRVALLRSHRRFIRPNGAILTVSGRTTRSEVEQLVEKVFGKWDPSQAELPPPPAITTVVTPGIYFIEQPLQQSTITVAQRGVPRLTPDHLAIEAFNSFFGSGGFGSRLMKKVRTEGGLAYSVFGSIMPAVTKGKNVLFLQTRTDAAALALTKALNELKDMQTTAVPESELAETKSALVDSFVFNFDSPARVMNRRASFELLGYPSDYDERYISEVKKLAPEDIRSVAQRRWDPSQFVVVIVGNRESYEKIEDLMKSPPELIKGLALKRVQFDEKLRLGDAPKTYN
jgi:zinc protease